MRAFAASVQEVFREAAARWVLIAYFALSSLFILIFALGVNLDIVDGALAGARLFGQSVDVGGEHIEIDKLVLGFESGFSGFLYLVGTFLCRRWIAGRGIVATVRRAGWLALAAAAAFLLPELGRAHNAVTLTGALWLMLLAYGIYQPCGHVGMATPFPLQAGAASALGGFIFAVAAFASGTWMGLMFQSGSTALLALTTGVLSACSGLTCVTLLQRHGQPAVAAPIAQVLIDDLSRDAEETGQLGLRDP